MSRMVSEWMTVPVVSVAEDTPVGAAINAMRARHLRHLCVVRGSALVGIVSDRDIKRALPSPLSGACAQDYEAILDKTLVSRVMTREPTSIAPEALLRDAVRAMLELKVSALPVIRHEAGLVGIITESDCLRALGDLLFHP